MDYATTNTVTPPTSTQNITPPIPPSRRRPAPQGLRNCRAAALLIVLLTLLPHNPLWGQTEITSLSGIVSASGHYVIAQDIDASTFTTSIATFSGTLEARVDPTTHMPYRIKNLSVPLFATLSGTVRNLLIESVDISQSGRVGAIAGTANGAARIYNVGIMGGTMNSTGNYCGGLVGMLDGTARVINCYSYADLSGGT